MHDADAENLKVIIVSVIYFYQNMSDEQHYRA